MKTPKSREELGIWYWKSSNQPCPWPWNECAGAEHFISSERRCNTLDSCTVLLLNFSTLKPTVGTMLAFCSCSGLKWLRSVDFPDIHLRLFQKWTRADLNYRAQPPTRLPPFSSNPAQRPTCQGTPWGEQWCPNVWIWLVLKEKELLSGWCYSLSPNHNQSATSHHDYCGELM